MNEGARLSLGASANACESAPSNASAPASAPLSGAPASAPASAASTSRPPDARAPVKVQLKAVGSAPLLRRSKFRCDATESVATIARFLRQELALVPEQPPLFLYVSMLGGEHFLPAPTDLLGDLAFAFGTESELLLSYALQAAFN